MLDHWPNGAVQIWMSTLTARILRISKPRILYISKFPKYHESSTSSAHGVQPRPDHHRSFPTALVEILPVSSWAFRHGFGRMARAVMLIHVDFTEDGTVCTVCTVCTVYIVYVMYRMYVMYGNSHQHLETTAKHPAWISGIACNHFVLSAYLHQSCCLVGKDHPLRPPPMRIGKRPSTVWGGGHVGHVGHAQMLRETMRNRNIRSNIEKQIEN